MPGPKCPQEGVLDDVIRIGFVAGQGQGEAIDIVDPGKSFPFKCDVTLSQCTMCVWHVS